MLIKSISFFSILTIMISCNAKQPHSKIEIEIDSMASIDQAIIAKIENSTFPDREDLLSEQQSILRENTLRAKGILKEFGYPGTDKVSKETSTNFWLIVQHSDHDIEFQKEVLSILAKEVKLGHALVIDYAYLLDRVRVNEGLPQIYGTQVYYDSLNNPQPKNVENPDGLDSIRKSVGLEPISQYLQLLKASRLKVGDTIKGNFIITN
ncbi:MAG: hypothetical protein KA713_03975 [Chryseotalea sp. WA131a]|nr:MAG: hypothetical protein KA713_03975 [Chryseotalea sp. WA131a]